jgi:hypothetical protein
MGRPTSRILVSVMALAAFVGMARAQAVTEYDSEISRSVTTGRKANRISSEIRGVWNSLDKTLKAAQEGTGSQEPPSGRTTQRASGRSTVQGASRPPAVAATHEDPSGIQPGISHTELVRRFGRPDFEVTASPGTTMLTYFRKDGSIDLELQDGKVTKVVPSKPQEIAVVAPK